MPCPFPHHPLIHHPYLSLLPVLVSIAHACPYHSYLSSLMHPWQSTQQQPASQQSTPLPSTDPCVCPLFGHGYHLPTLSLACAGSERPNSPSLGKAMDSCTQCGAGSVTSLVRVLVCLNPTLYSFLPGKYYSDIWLLTTC